VDAIHSMILDDRKISAKNIPETLVLSWEMVGYIIHEILDIRKLSGKWVPKCLDAAQKCDRVGASQAILDWFRWDPVEILNSLPVSVLSFLCLDDLYHSCNSQINLKIIIFKSATNTSASVMLRLQAMARVLIIVRCRKCSLRYLTETGSGAPQAPCPLGTGTLCP
jgi:hypothetical protein